MKINLTLLLLLSGLGLQAQQYNLASLKEKARAANPQEQSVKLMRDLSSQKTALVAGNYLPQLGLNSQASWQSAVTSLPITLPNVSILPPPKDQYKVTLDVTQNLYDGGLTKAQKNQEQSSLAVSEQQIATALQQLDAQVNQFYFQVLLTDRQTVSTQLLLDDIEKRMSVMNAAVENGIATKSEFLTIKAKQIELIQKIRDLKEIRKASIKALELLTKESIPENAVLENTPITMMEVSENSRAEMALFTAQQHMLGTSEQLIKAKNRPKIGAFATGGYGRPGLNFLARDFSSYFIGGVKLSIPLTQFYSGSQSNELQQIKINQQLIEKQREQFLMANEVQQNMTSSEINRLESQLQSDKELIAIREQVRKTAEVQLENGTITASTYIIEVNQEELANQNKALHEVQLMQAAENFKLLRGQ